MGTTRIKVIDLSSDQKEIKTSRKHAEKLSGLGKSKKLEKQAGEKGKSIPQEAVTTQTQKPETVESIQDQIPIPQPTPMPQARLKPSTHHTGKKYLKAKQLIENKIYTQNEAFQLLPKTSITKFDPTVEIHLNVSDKNIKGSVTFPHLKTVQKEKKYLIFADKPKDVKAKQIIWASEKTISDIESGTLKAGKDFDTVIASAKFMPALAKVAKILGPKGLMPNPKNGTITDNIEKVLAGSSDASGSTFQCDPTSAVIHSKIGKLSQKEEELKANLKALVLAIGPSKIKGATLTTTMGPGIKLDTNFA